MINIYQARKYVQETTATAGNTTVEISGVNSKRKFLISIVVELVCDATVANRYIRVYRKVTATGSPLGPTFCSPAVTASQTHRLAMGMGRTAPIGGSFANDHSILGFEPLQMAVDAGQYFQVLISSGVAGDAYTIKWEIAEVPC